MDIRRRSFVQFITASSIFALCPLSAAYGQQDGQQGGQQAGQEPGGRYFFLTEAEARFLTAACDRLIPEDEFPSASQAGVVDHIDLQLATRFGRGERYYLQGPWANGADTQGYQLPHTPAQLFRQGIAAIDESIGEGGFAGLPGDRMDLVLTELEEGVRDAGDVPGSVFFSFLADSTIEGYFADPIYNGNRDHAGWRMIGFPGAHAYYITEIDRYDLAYHRPPSGIAFMPGRGEPRPVTSATAREAASW